MPAAFLLLRVCTTALLRNNDTWETWSKHNGRSKVVDGSSLRMPSCEMCRSTRSMFSLHLYTYVNKDSASGKPPDSATRSEVVRAFQIRSALHTLLNNNIITLWPTQQPPGS